VQSVVVLPSPVIASEAKQSQKNKIPNPKYKKSKNQNDKGEDKEAVSNQLIAEG
jgi:hypothetical protein